jgi:hypothetical protein
MPLTASQISYHDAAHTCQLARLRQMFQLSLKVVRADPYILKYKYRVIQV